MKNFKNGLSKTVAPLYFADTYGFAIRKPLRMVYQTTGMVEPYPNTPSRGVTRDRIKRGVAKLLEKFIKDNTYGFAIRGHRIKRGVAKLLEKFIKDNTYGFAIRGHRIKRGVAL